MYNPRAWPYVNHFSGTDLIIDHTERYVCPTISSDQVLYDKTFRFRGDDRKHVAIIMAENEYDTNKTLTDLARTHLYKDFRVSLIYGPEPIEQAALEEGIPGLEALETADVLLISVRRKPLPPSQLKRVQEFVASGKPVIGIRTASHAFSLRDGSSPAGTASWPELDQVVFGGSYSNHYANDLHPTVSLGASEQLKFFLPDASSTKAINGYKSEGSLYQTAPLASGASVLLIGSLAGNESQPIAWNFVRPDGGRSFYTSLGHSSDFQSPVLRQLFVNAIRWSVDLPPNSIESMQSHESAYLSGHGRQRK
jgi:type 1 glutamine amidotransferase